MLANQNFLSILAIIFSLQTIATMVAIYQTYKTVDVLKRLFNQILPLTVAAIISLLVLWLSLPDTAVLANFYKPDSFEVGSFEQTVKYLRIYNEAIVRTTQVVWCLLLVCIPWLITVLVLFGKAINSRQASE